MSKYVIITEGALDAALMAGTFSGDPADPLNGEEIHKAEIGDTILGYRVANESPRPVALVGTEWLRRLSEEGGRPADIFQRIARVVKALRTPPVHLPRQWSEYHYRNLLAFFALPRDASNIRWVVDFGGTVRCARFDFLSDKASEVDLANFVPSKWPVNFEQAIDRLFLIDIPYTQPRDARALAQEIDLRAIGSSSVVSGRTYEEWTRELTESQKRIVSEPVSASIRIVGPAGSGKTLSLCMRALQVSRDEGVEARGERVLIATHSWAMAERIDGVLTTLNGQIFPDRITIYPLLSLLELHAGHIGHRRTEVIGDDSTDGRVKSLEIISQCVNETNVAFHSGLSQWILDSLDSLESSRARLELTVNLYEEISGVLTASGVSPDDSESVKDYIGADREDWMPPFPSVQDRGFVISVYKLFMQNLVDRSAITTDQFVLDSIRVLETFTWRMKKETEGYDYIFVDELQLFDPQERTALELLGRSRKGVPFTTAEDPSQGVFSTLNSRRSSAPNYPVYLDTVHRFNREIFEFIAYVYQRFPLNAIPLKIDEAKPSGQNRPRLYTCDDDAEAADQAVTVAREIYIRAQTNERICIVTLGDVDAKIVSSLREANIPTVRLSSFDDVDQLSYSKRSIVVSPWEFIGGTQFSHVIVVAAGISTPTSQFSQLKEMISVYLACSRATDSLSITSSGYVPAILLEAADGGLLVTQHPR